MRLTIRENLKNARFPRTQSELARAIRRDLGTIEELIHGERSLTDQTLLGLAVALDCPLSCFLPEPYVWIAQTTQVLSNDSVSKEDAIGYALYRTAQSPRESAPLGAELDAKAIAKAVQNPNGPALTRRGLTERVLKVVRVLGPIIEPLIPCDATTW